MEIEKHLWLRGLKQAQIADDLGISQNYLSDICAGKRELPLRLVIPLAALVQASVEDVVNAFATVRKAYVGNLPG